MPNIQFKKVFVPLILDKQKTMTLRGFNKQKFEIGGTLYFQNGYRANARFGTAKIISVRKVYFSRNGDMLIHHNAPNDDLWVDDAEWVNQCGFEDFDQAFEWYNGQGFPVAHFLQLIGWGNTFHGNR